MRRVDCLCLIVALGGLAGCNGDLIEQLQDENKLLKGELNAASERVAFLSEEVENVKTENSRLRETAQTYLGRAVELEAKGDRSGALMELQELLKRFPTSEIVSHAEAEIQRLLALERNELKLVFANVKNVNPKEAVRLLNEFLSTPRPLDVDSDARKALGEYEEKYEKERKYLEAQEKTGVSVESIETYWSWSGLLGDRIFSPHLKIKLKNVSEKSLERLVVMANFVTPSGEVFGTDTSYVIGLGDAPLRPNQKKSGFLNSSIGYTSDFIKIPSMKAEVYINDVYFKEVWVRRSHR